MQRTKKTFSVNHIPDFKSALLKWAQHSDTIAFLDSNNYTQNYTSLDCVLAIDEFTALQTDFKNAFDQLNEYQSICEDYIFGFLSYDLKNDVEALSSTNIDYVGFADLYFFQPKKLIFIKGQTVEFLYLSMVDDEIDNDFKDISQLQVSALSKTNDTSNIKINARIPKEDYLKKVNKLLKHIQRGDVYEVNFCQEFYAENATIKPVQVYNDLIAISEPPFATFLKVEHQYLLSASPERYLKKEANNIISQPIKGTAKRHPNKQTDEKISKELELDEKERSENIMVVDIVRNDLSKTAIKGSVKTEELCKVYSFKQVHQLISTVVSKVSDETHPVDVLKKSFPMGSMTGAPKLSAMKFIETLEETKRGLYSGAVGYFTPKGDFDFNVVIRSILYNNYTNYVSYSVGGAITAKSIPELEYEECLLKAKALKQVLTKFQDSH